MNELLWQFLMPGVIYSLYLMALAREVSKTMPDLLEKVDK